MFTQPGINVIKVLSNPRKINKGLQFYFAKRNNKLKIAVIIKCQETLDNNILSFKIFNIFGVIK